MPSPGAPAAYRSASHGVRGVSKRYGGVKALTGVDFQVRAGEVHAIVGENGAGKSTLMKILAGAESPDSGSVLHDGNPIRLRSVADGNAVGIAIVFQELSVYPDIDVLGNLFMLHEPTRFGIVDRRTMRTRARVVLEELGLSVDLDAPVATLRLAERQLLEICRALLTDASVLILDEPNSALNAAESDRLFDLIGRLRSQGVAVIYVSHRLEEVLRIADVITIMRNGAVVRTLPASEASVPGIVADMLGGRTAAPLMTRRRTHTTTPNALRMDAVTTNGELHDVTLSVHPGEILGLAGLEGSGIRGVFDVLFGAYAQYSGMVTLPDGSRGPRSIRDAVGAGIARIPSDRRRVGASLQQSVTDNLVQVTAGVLGRYGFLLGAGTLDRAAQTQVDLFRIAAPSVSSPMGRLSGGNQQKVVLSKWLAADPAVVLLDDPTRGIDVAAKQEVYRRIRKMADEGRVVLFTSSELPEFALLCDSVAVFYRGRLVGTYRDGDFDQHRLLEAINTGRIA